MNEKRKVNAPKSVAVDTTKKQNVSQFKARQSRARLNDKQLISINTEKAKVIFDTMPTQVQLLIMNIDQICIDNDKCSLLVHQALLRVERVLIRNLVTRLKGFSLKTLI